ncbi:sodium channel protein Nach-like [Odontomachus brunneus]|uniref:sodium channel protein Nach-like n=1 Tax=Odontomachus brunneus TaxID=486640 RepID=UPI0013F1859C|nr:sodium channel protein Nach-like [Odontomachus brunneus]
MWIEGDWIKSKNQVTFTTRNSRKSRAKFHCSFCKVVLKYLKFYCQYSSLVGVKYLASSRTWSERIVWIVIHCVIISSLLFIVHSSYLAFVTSPILTSMDSDDYHTTKLDFPGIAICSINRISRKSASAMADKIFHANVTNLSADEILTLLAQLGNLYASEFQMDEDRNEEVHQLLTTYHKGDYDITDIMKTLSPQCSIMLLKCKLHGRVRNCSSLFAFRKSQDGFCCIFNYAREDDDIPIMKDVLEPIKVHKVYDLGIDRGLSVLLEPFLDDYLYPMLPVTGWKILIFDPYDFPDVTSGGVMEILAIPRSETYVDVVASSFFSTKAIEGYPIAKRKCIFSKEIRTLYGGTSYTYSDCIVDCKIHDIQKICGCRPFMYPRRGKHEYTFRICNNMDMECLAKYKTKWWIVFPHEDKNDEENIPNNTWGLHCNNCYPVCEDISYDVLSAKSYMSQGRYKTDFLWNVTVKDQAILHVFFSKYGSLRLKQDVAYYWYELMSDIGSICGVFIGFSLISVVELLYFFTLIFREMLCKRWVIEDESRKKEIQSQPIRTIYWNELLPRSWQAAPYYGHLQKTIKKRTRY